MRGSVSIAGGWRAARDRARGEQACDGSRILEVQRHGKGDDFARQGWRDPDMVFFRRDEDEIAVVGFRQQRLDFRRRERVMIGKDPCRVHARADRGERGEEFLGPRDAREGENRAADQARGDHRVGLQAGAKDRLARRDVVDIAERIDVAADHDDSVDEARLSLERRSQRPRGQAKAVAEARVAIDHREGEILGEGRVLQARRP